MDQFKQFAQQIAHFAKLMLSFVVYGLLSFAIFRLLIEGIDPSFVNNTPSTFDLTDTQVGSKNFLFAFSAGCLGAFVRFGTRVPFLNLYAVTTFPGYLTCFFMVIVGGALGLVAYFFLESEVLVRLVYNVEGADLRVTGWESVLLASSLVH